MEAHPLTQGTKMMSAYPMGECCYGEFEMEYDNNP